MTILANVRLVDPEAKTEKSGWLRIDGKKIAEIGKLRGEIDQLNKNVAKRKAEIARTAAHARQAWEDHEAILNSTSWRITAPLRRVVELVRRR